MLCLFELVINTLGIFKKKQISNTRKEKKDVFCTNCGGSVLISHNYCGHCGTKKFDKNIKSCLI